MRTKVDHSSTINRNFENILSRNFILYIYICCISFPNRKADGWWNPSFWNRSVLFYIHMYIVYHSPNWKDEGWWNLPSSKTSSVCQWKDSVQHQPWFHNIYEHCCHMATHRRYEARHKTNQAQLFVCVHTQYMPKRHYVITRMKAFKSCQRQIYDFINDSAQISPHETLYEWLAIECHVMKFVY